MLTAFATYTDLLAPEDGAQSVVLDAAARFLEAERDIKHYKEYE